MVDWTDERIAALSDPDLKNLLANAERRSVADIVEKCRVELEKRNAAKPRKASKGRSELKEFEHAMSEQLATVGKEMAAKYDLSEETAKSKIGRCKGLQGSSAARLPKVTPSWGDISETAPSRWIDTSRIDAAMALSASASGCRRMRRSRRMNFMWLRQRECLKAENPSRKSGRVSQRKPRYDACHPGFQGLPDAAVAFDHALYRALPHSETSAARWHACCAYA